MAVCPQVSRSHTHNTEGKCNSRIHLFHELISYQVNTEAEREREREEVCGSIYILYVIHNRVASTTAAAASELW